MRAAHVLAGHDEVTLVLSVLVVQDHYQLASCYVSHGLRYAVEQPQRLLRLMCGCWSC